MKHILILLICISFVATGQSTFYKDSTTTLSSLPSDTVYRTGSVAISHAFQSPFQNKLMVTSIYDSTNSRGAYFSLNEPYDSDSASVGLATKSLQSHNTLVANNYANFKDGMTFTDVHNSTVEFNYFRGISDAVGFRDGGDLAKAAVAKLAGNFNNNGRDYKTTDFDILNMRFFTGTDPNNTAEITNFYALRFEDFRGVNTDMITNAWGVFIKPTILNNYFGGKVGIGSTDVSHPLTVNASTDPVKIVGLQSDAQHSLVSINADGVLKKQTMQDAHSSFLKTSLSTTLSDDYYLYIHEGGDVTYTLPLAGSRTGKTWKIVNIGTGSITLTQPFMEGDQARNTISNKAGAYSYELFSDGTQYIAIK